MVTAVKGVLIQCDVPTKVFIQHLDDQRPSSDKIIIDKSGLDDITVFIHAKHLDYIREELRKHKLSITFQPAENPLALLQRFLGVQAERAALYSTLATGFKGFLQGVAAGGPDDAVGYQALVARSTPGLAACSQQVIAIEAELRSPLIGRADLAALLRRVQEGERQKLQATLTQHAVRVARAVDEQQAKLRDRGAHGHAPSPSHPCGHTCAHHASHDDVFVADQGPDASLRAALLQLDASVTAINDALEEVREAVEQLQQPGP